MTKTNENLANLEPRGTFTAHENNFASHTPSLESTKKNHSRRWKYTKPDLQKQCLLCDQQIKVKYNLVRRQYSQKNNWGYWTNKENNQHKYLCNTCLKRNLLGNFKSWGINTEKSRIFHAYLFQNKFNES